MLLRVRSASLARVLGAYHARVAGIAEDDLGQPHHQMIHPVRGRAGRIDDPAAPLAHPVARLALVRSARAALHPSEGTRR
jgi:hypothetical protein